MKLIQLKIVIAFGHKFGLQLQLKLQLLQKKLHSYNYLPKKSQLLLQLVFVIAIIFLNYNYNLIEQLCFEIHPIPNISYAIWSPSWDEHKLEAWYSPLKQCLKSFCHISRYSPQTTSPLPCSRPQCHCIYTSEWDYFLPELSIHSGSLL